MYRQVGYIFLTAVMLFIASMIGFLFRMMNWADTNTVLVYLLAVLMTSRLTNGYKYGIISSIIATFLFNYLFTEPYYTLAVYDSRYFITFLIMTVTALITSALTTKIQKSTEASRSNEEQMKILYSLTHHISDALDNRSLGNEIVKILSDYFRCPVGIVFFSEKESMSIYGQGDKIEAAVSQNEDFPLQFANLDAPYMIRDNFCYYPLQGVDHLLGVFKLPVDIAMAMDDQKNKLVISMMENISLALEHIDAINEQLKLKETTVKERYRSNLLRAISHDLRTPLTGIMGTSEMIMGISDKKEETYQLAYEIYDEAKWLFLMVENILSLTKVQEGKLVIHKKSEPVEEVIGSAIYRVTKNSRAYQINVDVPDEVLMVDMDARLIEQVLINLLDNAIKHESKRIDIKAFQKEQWAYVVVEDYGVGFKNQNIEQLFEMFYTEHSGSNVDVNKGAGLGLTICKAIVEAHDGKIRAEKCENHSGSKFLVMLPMGDVNESQNISC